MKVLQNLISVILAVSMVTAPVFAINKKHLTKIQEQQHKAMHEIVMVDRDPDGVIQGGGLCTATAIGPHTLLTATHCNDPSTDQIYIDQMDRDAIKNNTAPYYIVASRQFDHQDHMLLDIKGANFKVYIYLGPNVRLPKQSEPTYEWGCPNGVFDQYRQGVVSGTIKLSDIGDTEVDATGPLVYLVQESVIGGDSGSAVYSQVDGQLIGIVTYGFDSGQFMGMFPIQFTGEQIEASMQ